MVRERRTFVRAAAAAAAEPGPRRSSSPPPPRMESVGADGLGGLGDLPAPSVGWSPLLQATGRKAWWTPKKVGRLSN